MKLVNIARRRPDGLIDPQWVEGFDAFRSHGSAEACPYRAGTEEFDRWIEGWTDAAATDGLKEQETSR
jgi:ribosome modulation factor